MKICFPVIKNDGIQSEVFSHLRLAPLLLVVDSETEDIIEINNAELRDLRGLDRFQALASAQKIDAMLVLEIGMGAEKNLQAVGIQVLQALPGTIAENIKAFSENKLTEFEREISNMNGQGRVMGPGMGLGHRLNCRGTIMGSGMGRKQGLGCRQQLAGRGQGFAQGLGRTRNLAADEAFEPGMGRGRGQGRDKTGRGE